MFRVHGHSQRNPNDISRRSFLEAGILGVGGLALADVLKLQASGAAKTNRDTNVILFWLSGGPGHMETFDPKPNAVAQYKGPFNAISTSVPGVQFSETMPETAKLMHHLAVLRSVNHGSGDHTKGNHWMLTGFEGPAFNAPDNKVQKRPAMGSVVSVVRGPNRPGIPAYAAVPHLRGGTDNIFHYAAYLGGGANPFIVNSDPNSKRFRVQNLALRSGLTFDRLADRRRLLETIDDYRSRADQRMDDVGEHQRKAFDLLTSKEVRQAFDINAEPDALRDSYGRHTFGQSALLARRLVERGVTFVTVNSQPWDHHGTANRLPTEKGAKKLIPPLDVAIAGLVRDLIDRGLYEKTLIVAMGEFGRTPRMNAAGGRDHWGKTFSVLMGGGGMRMGQVIGKSSERGEYVAERPLDPQDVTATVFHHLGIDARETALHDRTNRPNRLVEKGNPVRELIG